MDETFRELQQTEILTEAYSTGIKPAQRNAVADVRERGAIVKAAIDANPVIEKIPTNQNRAYEGLLDGYYLQKQSYEVTYFDDVLPFTDFNIPKGNKFAQRKWRVKTSENPDDAAHVNDSYYNADLGVIVTASMYSKDDGWPKDAPEKNPASEITWKSWAEVAGETKIENLEFNFQVNIKNWGTESVIIEAYKRQGPPLDALATGSFSMSGRKEEQEAFLALLGTDNTRPIEYMLKDHFTQVGQKKIQKIWVYPFQRDEMKPVEIGWNMVLEIGRDT